MNLDCYRNYLLRDPGVQLEKFLNNFDFKELKWAKTKFCIG